MKTITKTKINMAIKSIFVLFSMVMASCFSPNLSTQNLDSSSSVMCEKNIQTIFNFYQKQGGDMEYVYWVNSLFGDQVPASANLSIGNDGNWYIGKTNTFVKVILPHNEQLFNDIKICCGYGLPSHGSNKGIDIYIDYSSWKYFAKNNSQWFYQGIVNGICSDRSVFEHEQFPKSDNDMTVLDYPTKIFIPCNDNLKIVFKAKSFFQGNQPTIRFKTSMYQSPLYLLSNSNLIEQSWRIPPSVEGDEVEIEIETNDSKIEFECFTFFYEPFDVITSFYETEYEFDSHLGFIEMCPEHTKASVKMSGILGYESCVVVPKVTLDGVIVCIHDDSINRTASLEDYTFSDEIMVSELTYQELLQYDFGVYKNTYYKGERILLLDDFFGLCKEYGMEPIFSTHPGLSIDQWIYVKEMLEKYELLDQFTIKGFGTDVLATAYVVFGSNIKGYTGDNITVEEMDRFVLNNSIKRDCLKLTIETELKLIDEELVDEIKSHGYYANAFTIKSSFSEMELRKYISKGITGFVDDSYCQQGMQFLNF